MKWAAPDFYEPAAIDKVYSRFIASSFFEFVPFRKCAGCLMFVMAVAAVSICVRASLPCLT